MPSDIKIRFGKTRGRPEHYFRVQASWDGGRSFTDALVMKRDDRDGRPGTNSTPYNVVWAATGELEGEAEAVLGRLEKRFSAKHNKNELRRFLKDVPRHYVPSDAEVPDDLGVRIAKSPFRFESQYGPLETWEQRADAAALRRAGIGDRAGDEGGARTMGLFQWVPWFDRDGEPSNGSYASIIQGEIATRTSDSVECHAVYICNRPTPPEVSMIRLGSVQSRLQLKMLTEDGAPRSPDLRSGAALRCADGPGGAGRVVESAQGVTARVPES